LLVPHIIDSRGKVYVITGNTDKMNRLQYVFVSFALLLFLAPIAKAQGTYTAKSCSYADVNAIINGPTHTAVRGDTINIPAGTCAWSSTLNIHVPITLQGAGAEYSSSWNGTNNTLVGADQTVINPQVGANSVILVNTTLGNPLMRITGIAFLDTALSGDPGGGIVNLGGNGNNVRVDHLHFFLSHSEKGIYVGGSVTGVADHIFMDVSGTSITNDFAFYNGVGWNGTRDPNGYGDGSFADTDHFGSSQLFYVEDSYFNNGYESDCVNGGRYAARYSTIVNSAGFAAHGLTGGANRGCRVQELYMLNVSFPGTGPDGAIYGASIGHPNSGTLLAWGNTTSNFNSIVGMAMERLLNGEGRDAEELNPAPAGWGYCGTKYSTGSANGSTAITGTGFQTTWPTPFNMIIPGALCTGAYGDLGNVCKVASVQSSTSLTLAVAAAASVSGVGYTVGSPWDGGLLATGYPCMDSPARGRGDLLNGANFPNRLNTVTGTTAWPHQALSPIYVFANNVTIPGPSSPSIIFDGTGILADNRDYYQQFGAYGEPGTFNGTKGVGQGSSLPSEAQPTCTTSSNPIAPNTTWLGEPVTGNWGPGYWDTTNSTLYVCTATNTWTAYYTPYTYPHPLTAGTSGSSVNPPTGLVATVQ
jgi:hypothetical protein